MNRQKQNQEQPAENEPNYRRLAAMLKLLAHPERLRILDVLRRDVECVRHLELLLAKPQPYVSQQLRLLREVGVIVDEKEGNNVFYRLVDPQIAAWLDTIIGSVDPAHDDRQHLTRHRRLAGCLCPKCASNDEETGIAVTPNVSEKITTPR
jgi:ArsR family transcriptional regulator